MALLTFIQNPAKGSATTVQLTKSELFDLIPAGDYFKTEANVAKCKITYQSTVGKQKKYLYFDLSPTSTLMDAIGFSIKARDVFAISSIVLYDYDGGSFIIPSPDIPSGLEIDMTPVQGQSVLLTGNIASTESVLFETQTSVGGAINDYMSAGDVISFRMTFNQNTYLEYINFLSDASTVTVKNSSQQTLFSGPTETLYGFKMIPFSPGLQINSGDYLDFTYVNPGNGSMVGDPNYTEYTISEVAKNETPLSFNPRLRYGVLGHSAALYSTNNPGFVEKTILLSSMTYTDAALTGFVQGTESLGITSDVFFNNMYFDYIDSNLMYGDPVSFWGDSALFPTQKTFILANYPDIAAAVANNYTDNMDYMDDFGYQMGISQLMMDKPQTGYQPSSPVPLSQASTLIDQTPPAGYEVVSITFSAKAKDPFTFTSITVPIASIN